jgi:hypothetical protein
MKVIKVRAKKIHESLISRSALLVWLDVVVDDIKLRS